MSFKFSHTMEVPRANSTEKHKRIHTFLKHNYVGVLATTDFENNPDASAIYYSIDGQFNISFSTKAGTKKFENLQLNNNVSLVVFDALAQTAVSIKGNVSEVKSAEKSRKIFLDTLEASLKSSDGNLPPISKLSLGSYVAYTIKPQKIVLANYGRSKEKTNNRVFEFIDF